MTWLDPGAFGTLGVGGGFALGAKLARPDSEVIIYLFVFFLFSSEWSHDLENTVLGLTNEISFSFFSASPQVWIVWGDGSCGYSVAEFDTFTRFNLPVMAIVGNDAGWTQILREQLPVLGTDVACKLNVKPSHFHNLTTKLIIVSSTYYFKVH